MAKRKTAKKAGEIEVDVQEVTGNVAEGPFWERNQNLILYILGGLLLVFGAWWAYRTLIIAPQQKEAEAAMWQAQLQFERDSFRLALEDPGGGYDGFLGIIEKFGSTKAGNLAHYYAGVCYLQMGDFDTAISHLEDFNAAGNLLPTMRYGTLGDCYSEKGDFEKARSMYNKAADAGQNDLLCAYYLKKSGLLAEKTGDKKAALKAYERIKKEFPNQNSADWRDIDKYIERVAE